MRPARKPVSSKRNGAVWVALVAGLTGAALAAGCSEERPDTTRLGSELLSSRTSTGQVPVSGGEAEAPMSVAPGRPEPESAPPLDLASLGHDVGDEDAPLRIIEFSDFACGYCRMFHLETWPALEEEYVATGKVLWKYVPMILGMFGPNADDAALAGECALEQGRFPAVRDRLFEDQSSWKRVDEPREVFRGIVREEGLDEARWQRCMDDGGRERRVAQGTALSRQLGVRGTPTFFVLGYGAIPGAAPLELFRELLDTIYAEVAPQEAEAGDELVPGSGGFP